MDTRKVRQVELRFTPVSQQQPLFGSDWRRLVAQRLQTPILSPAESQVLFHHRDDGRSADGKPSVCFVASPSWVGVVATGDAAAAVVSRRLGELVLTAQGALGPCAVDHHEHTLGLRYEAKGCNYRVRSFVGNAKDRELTPLRVRSKLTSTLNAWAQDHGVCEPGEPLIDMKDVILESVQRLSPLVEAAGEGRMARTRAEVRFYMPWHLDGNWFVGSQTSKGHGLARFVQSMATQERLAAEYAEAALHV